MCSAPLKHSILQPEMDSSSLTADTRSRIHPQATQSDLCISQVVLVLALAAAACGCALHSLCTAIYSFSLTADITIRSISTDNSLPSTPMYISCSVGAGLSFSSLWMQSVGHAPCAFRTAQLLLSTGAK